MLLSSRRPSIAAAHLKPRRKACKQAGCRSSGRNSWQSADFRDCNDSMLLSLVSRALGFVSNLKDFALIGGEKLALAEGVDRITF